MESGEGEAAARRAEEGRTGGWVGEGRGDREGGRGAEAVERSEDRGGEGGGGGGCEEEGVGLGLVPHNGR